MEQNKLQNLLLQVRAVSERYSKINELTGENFNVFRILKLESSEVRMHSAFIAELLNPKGSHGQGDLFLKLFINMFCFKGHSFQADKSIVEVEKHLGFVTDDEKEGGRVDIVISDNQHHKIIIENKVYAKDGKYQLLRYHNFYVDADIIYLSLDGVEPNEISRQHLRSGIHYKCVSYRNDIIQWLEACRKEVPTLAVIREGITHYINLVKYLTNQTSNKEMKNELIEVLSSNLKESFLIADHLDSTCERIAKSFGEKFIKECLARGFKCEWHLNFNNRYSSVWVWKDEWKYLCIGFGLQSYDKDMRYGFIIDPDKTVLPDELRKQITGLPHNHSNPSDQWWPWASAMEQPLNDWSKYPAWEAILDGTMQESMFRKIDELIDLTKDFDI